MPLNFRFPISARNAAQRHAGDFHGRVERLASKRSWSMLRGQSDFKMRKSLWPLPPICAAAVPMVQVPGTVHFSPGRALDADACPSGGAGMVGTADDVLRLLDMLQSDGGGLLSPHTLRRMTSLQADAAAQAHGPGWAFG